jgi:ribosomal protein S18 acetylase RimI-like enzyme
MTRVAMSGLLPFVTAPVSVRPARTRIGADTESWFGQLRATLGGQMRTDADLYRRGMATLLASWDEYARPAAGASLRRLPGVAVAVFPKEPERGVYNNAVLERGLAAAARARAVDAMEGAYAAAGIDTFAAWVDETDAAAADDLERRGYTLSETTRAMGMELDAIALPRPEADIRRSDWTEYLEVDELPPGLLAGVDPDAFHVAVGRLDGERVAVGIALDHDGDCGIFNLGTKARARRRGMGTAVTAALVHDARDRGCETASLQSTPMAERVYTAVGFRDLGRILEYTPPANR